MFNTQNASPQFVRIWFSRFWQFMLIFGAVVIAYEPNLFAATSAAHDAPVQAASRVDATANKCATRHQKQNKQCQLNNQQK